jgi:Tripartite tricarboxylate transporter family receptor
LIKANPGKYSFAHTGIGTTPHLSGEMFKLASAIDIVAVPFNGGAPAAHSAVAGHTPILFTSVSGGVPLVRDGKLRVLAVAAKARAGASGCANSGGGRLQRSGGRNVQAMEAVSEYHRAGRVYEGQRHAGSGSLSDILSFRRPTGR